MYINDRVWGKISNLIPAVNTRRRGRPRADQRAVLSGILACLVEEIPWRALPTRRYGVSGNTCWRQFREWVRSDSWTSIESALIREWPTAKAYESTALVASLSRSKERVDEIRNRRPRKPNKARIFR